MAERGRENEGPLPEPIAYFLTWPTYGTWLPGDERGWVEYRRGWQLPDPVRKLEAQARMTEGACVLDDEQRRVVERTIREHCQIRGWTLHAVNCRTNHLHVVVTAQRHPDEVREQFKAWCTRKLKALERSRGDTNPTRKRGRSIRENWWAERGSKRYINDEESLEAAVLYVRDGQDEKH
jgi:REP element-mobilizing transposase RayT